MATIFQFAFSSPVAGMEAEFQRWYSEDHLPHSVKLPVVSAGQRFQRVDGTPWPAGRHDNLVIWELVGDPARAIETLLASHGTDDMPISPAIDMTSVQPPTMQLLKRVVDGTESELEAEPVAGSRGPLLLAFLNAVDGEAAALKRALEESGVQRFSMLPGAGAVSLWQTTDAQLRGSARKYRFLLMFEPADEQQLLAALAGEGDQFTAIPYSDPERMFAALYRPLTERVTG